MRFSVGNLDLIVDQDAGTIECQSTAYEETSFVSRLAARCQSNGKEIDLISSPWSISHIKMDPITTPVGSLVGTTIEMNTCFPGAGVILRVGLSQEIDMAFIQLEVRNDTDLPLSVEDLSASG